MSTRVCVVGSVNMDSVFAVPTLPKPGETILASSAQLLPGGKGGNQAVAAARAGGKVALVGRGGTDLVGAGLVHRCSWWPPSVATHTVGSSAIIWPPTTSGSMD
jgi:ribokinase